MAAITICSDFGAPKIKSDTVSPSICHEVMWPDFNFLGSKITADGYCSREIKRRLFLGRNAVTNLESILESKDIALLTKVHLVKAMAFQWSWMDVKVGV